MDDTGGICYEESLTTDMLGWDAAYLRCSSSYGRLASVLNEEMSFEIERVTQDSNECWIGLYRVDSNSEFMWQDGSSVSYTRWSTGHPINGLNCVSVRRNSTGGTQVIVRKLNVTFVRRVSCCCCCCYIHHKLIA